MSDLADRRAGGAGLARFLCVCRGVLTVTVAGSRVRKSTASSGQCTFPDRERPVYTVRAERGLSCSLVDYVRLVPSGADDG